MSVTLLALVAIGFLGWWATGIDDTLALALLLGRAPTGTRTAIFVGHIVSVVFVLAVASAVVLGALQLAPGILGTRIFGLPLQNLAGLLPIGIGVLTLREVQHGNDDDEAPQPNAPREIQVGHRLLGWAFIGAQVYLINSVDDLALHLGVLGGVIHHPVEWSAAAIIAAFWIGNLGGELTSLATAHWLAVHFRARQNLEIGAALALIAVGAVVLLTGR